MMKRKGVICCIIYFTITCICTLLFIGEARFFFSAYNIKFEEQARIGLDSVSALLSQSFAKSRGQTDSITYSLISKSTDKTIIKEEIASTVNSYPIDGLYFNLSGPDSGYSLLYSKRRGFIRIPDTNNTYKQYTEQTHVKNHAWWIPPIMDELMGERIIGCCIPFKLEDSTVVVMILYNITHIDERLQRMGLNRFGLPYIMDTTTAFIAHPLSETQPLSQLAQDYNDDALIKLAEDLCNGRYTNKNYWHSNTVTGQQCNEMAAHIDETGWILGLSVYSGSSLESASYRQAMKRSIIRMTIYFVLVLIAMLFFINNVFDRLKLSLCYCYLLPFLFVSAIVMVVVAYDIFPANGDLPKQQKSNDTIFEDIYSMDGKMDILNSRRIKDKWDPQRIVDMRSLTMLTDAYTKQVKQLSDEPVKLIPTGLYIHTIQFNSSREIRVSGILWQKYLIAERAGSPYLANDYTQKGVIFPSAKINSYELTDSLNIFMDGERAMLYRWSFDIDIPETLSCRLYPFGISELKLPLWSANMDDNTLIIPDLDAYKQTFPDICPGLSAQIDISGWDIASSYYSYSIESYLTNFGNTDMRGLNKFPELMFNISVSRKFIDSLIGKIIPLLVVLILLYTILFVRNDSDGFNNIIGCSGLFFVLVFDHISLRETVASSGIMYLEYCYFFTYLLLLLITATSFRIDSNKKINTVLKITDKFLRLYFWTVILGLMAIASILIFY